MSYPQMSEDVLSLFVRFITLKKAKLLMGYVPFGVALIALAALSPGQKWRNTPQENLFIIILLHHLSNTSGKGEHTAT